MPEESKKYGGGCSSDIHRFHYFSVQGQSESCVPQLSHAGTPHAQAIGLFDLADSRMTSTAAVRPGPYNFKVSHFDADSFIFWLGAPQGHTLSCISITFRQLDEIHYAYVQSCRVTTLRLSTSVETQARPLTR